MFEEEAAAFGLNGNAIFSMFRFGDGWKRASTAAPDKERQMDGLVGLHLAEDKGGIFKVAALSTLVLLHRVRTLKCFC